MKVIGLTGSFGTGKTFVASIFKELGGRVLDADKIAHHFLARRSPAYRRIVAEFGDAILNSRGDIDHRALAGIVFKDRAKLKKLNAIIHPEVIRAIKRDIARYKNKVVVVDAPLLVEAKLTGIVDLLVVVTCSRKRQVERCKRKFGMTKGDINRRIRSQMPLKKKAAMADYIVNNDGAKAETRRQVAAIWRKVWR